MIPRRMWLEIDPLYPGENCSAYPDLTSCEEDSEAENEVERVLYVSGPALRNLIRRWKKFGEGTTSSLSAQTWMNAVRELEQVVNPDVDD